MKHLLVGVLGPFLLVKFTGDLMILLSKSSCRSSYTFINKGLI